MRHAKSGIRNGRRQLRTPHSALRTPNSALFSIHPAVRDGFLSGIGESDRTTGHEAARAGLSAALGDSPGKNPSDPATLDLLEEIVHHTLQSGHVQEAWDVYWNRIGGGPNLLHRLGAYERGARLCRAIAGGQPPESVGAWVAVVERSEPTDELGAHGSSLTARPQPPFLELSESDQAKFINEWALYLTCLGRLEAAAHCFELNIEMRMRQENWKNASRVNQNLCDVRLLAGKVEGGRLNRATLPFRFHPSEEALRLAELADDAQGRQNSYAYRGQARAVRGEVPAALADFRECLDWQHKVDGDDESLYSNRGIFHTHLLARLGRREESQRLTEANIEIERQSVGAGNNYEPKCRLILASLQLAAGDVSAAERLSHAARDWALARDAKEVLCWSALVQARIKLARSSPPLPWRGEGESVSHRPNHPSPNLSPPGERDFGPAQAALDEGLKIARACGFSLYHIDLQLEVARLRLLQGCPSEALAALRVALDETRPANPETGEPELLAANDPNCGYAWPKPEGLQLRAEALLLQAAQELGASQFDPEPQDQLPAKVDELVDQAEACLNESLEFWRPLRDPARKNANFRHPKTRRQYNFRARETYGLLDDLNKGVLTRLSLENQDGLMPNQPKVFVSHSSSDKPTVRRIIDELEKHQVAVWFDEQALGVGDSIVEGIQTGLSEADYLLVVLSENSAKSNWVKNELNSALMEEASSRAIVVLPAVIDDCEIPPLLKDRKFADFRKDFDAGLEGLLRVLSHESASVPPPPVDTFSNARGGDDCPTKLGGLKLAELRRRMTKRMSREEVAVVWFDVFESKMDNDAKFYTLVECVIELLDRAANRQILSDVISALCADRPDLANS